MASSQALRGREKVYPQVIHRRGSVPKTGMLELKKKQLSQNGLVLEEGIRGHKFFSSRVPLQKFPNTTEMPQSL